MPIIEIRVHHPQILEMLRCSFCKVWYWEIHIRKIQHRNKIKQTCVDCNPKD